MTEEPQNEPIGPSGGEGNSIDASAYYAAVELHYGRIAWLAEHIRRSDFHIDPLVARKILALIERTDPNLFFELRLVRRQDLHPAKRDPQLVEIRDYELAVEVARRGGFNDRGHLKKVCHDVGKSKGLTGPYVYRRVLRHRERALDVVAEERMQEAYERGEIDFLGRPISSRSGFEEDPGSL